MLAFISMRENYKFDLTTFGFNDQKSLVPSRSLNRVPTVLLFSLKVVRVEWGKMGQQGKIGHFAFFFNFEMI